MRAVERSICCHEAVDAGLGYAGLTNYQAARLKVDEGNQGRQAATQGHAPDSHVANRFAKLF